MNSTSIRFFIFVLLVRVLAVECKKQGEARPSGQMNYMDLKNAEIRKNSAIVLIDADHDGENDLTFYTLLTPDPISQVDKIQYILESSPHVNLLLNASSGVPIINLSQTITADDVKGWKWVALPLAVLVQESKPLYSVGQWEGDWNDANHKYVAFQLSQAGKLFNGWVEISADTTAEKMIFYKSAVSAVPNAEVRAGE